MRTKIVTATTALRLVERGEARLDQPLTGGLPLIALPSLWPRRPATVRRSAPAASSSVAV
jgi:CubicO group peptidase (beta-lactamase class C family)